MFIGEYQHLIDEKGRLAIPMKFRDRLGKGAVVTRGLDSCLFVFPMDEWKKLAEKLSSLPFSQANSRAFGLASKLSPKACKPCSDASPLMSSW